MRFAKADNAKELRAAVDRVGSWYHKIDLGMGVVTPGLDHLEPIWELIRSVRASLDYRDKRVLDIASFDGMWAFEAERLGAGITVATDCNYPAVHNFLFCRAQLGSGVVPYYNVSPYDLHARLDSHAQLLHADADPGRGNEHCAFDIVQHLGLLYHLRDPMHSLAQARSVTVTGGHLLLETAIAANDSGSFMVFNGYPPNDGRIYADVTTWWAPTVTCMREMLLASAFAPIDETLRVLPQSDTVARMAVVATATPTSALPDAYRRELASVYRHAGLVAPPLLP